MTDTTNQARLDKLNAFRAKDGKDALVAWREARHAPMLNAYLSTEAFEATPDELAAQRGRESSDLARDKALEVEASKPKRERKAKASTEKGDAQKRLSAAISDDFANNKGVQEAAAEIAKAKSYKEVARYDKSLVDRPVGFVHQFLSDNPGMTRKQAVVALTEGYGINYSTARTQYQRWFSANKRRANNRPP